ncbi:hypothetical protein, partial [Mycoplasma sp. Z244C]
YNISTKDRSDYTKIGLLPQEAYDSYIKNIKMFQLQELNEAIKQFKDNSNYENMDLRIILLDSLGEKYEEAM